MTPMPRQTVTTGHSRSLRRRLQKAREARGLSQRELARRLGVSNSTISGWENFDKHPEIDNFARWARELGMRLVVDLEEDEAGRVPVLVSEPVVEIARAIDALDDDSRRLVRRLVRALPLNDPDDQYILDHDLKRIER